ncbi:MAG: AzlD domain-containing protein [Neomegalonema sp.]|nr:AzlD domain-containing protein [Neomegalonema sp.]
MSETFWFAVPILALGTFALRFIFLGYFVAKKPSDEWARALKYTPAAILPALAMPAVLFDSSGAWQSDPTRLVGAAAAIAIGVATRNVLWTVLGGMAAVWATTAVLTVF